MTVRKKDIIYIHRLLEAGGRSCEAGPHWKAPESAHQKAGQGVVSKSIYCGFCRKDWVRQDKWV